MSLCVHVCMHAFVSHFIKLVKLAASNYLLSCLWILTLNNRSCHFNRTSSLANNSLYDSPFGDNSSLQFSAIVSIIFHLQVKCYLGLQKMSFVDMFFIDSTVVMSSSPSLYTLNLTVSALLAQSLVLVVCSMRGVLVYGQSHNNATDKTMAYTTLN